MEEKTFDFSKNLTKKRKIEFAELLKALSNKIGFKVSSRGWCYIMEGYGYINKNQFNKVADAINDLRRMGMIPVDFTADEQARGFNGVVEEYAGDVNDVIDWMVRDVLNGGAYYTPDFWEDEEYYIQCVVEKIDLVTLFSPVCKRYRIPIANSKGWSSILQRAEYARRFKEAEDRGLKCVLLYCGDHDPDGLRISDTLRKNLEQVADIAWGDGQDGYDPANLIIDRFGLNLSLINKHRLTWIDNLITGSGANLASPKHPNHGLPYVKSYLKKIGERKCEANAIVTMPAVARALITEAIEKYLGPDAHRRFTAKAKAREAEYIARIKEIGLHGVITDFMDGRDAADMDDVDNDF